jgi:hypothetical protein
MYKDLMKPGLKQVYLSALPEEERKTYIELKDMTLPELLHYDKKKFKELVDILCPKYSEYNFNYKFSDEINDDQKRMA